MQGRAINNVSAARRAVGFQTFMHISWALRPVVRSFLDTNRTLTLPPGPHRSNGRMGDARHGTITRRPLVKSNDALHKSNARKGTRRALPSLIVNAQRTAIQLV